MSFLAKGVLAFSTATAAQDLPIPNETNKMIISGLFSLGSVLVVEFFKWLKTRKRTKLTNQNVEDKPTENYSTESGAGTLKADSVL